MYIGILLRKVISKEKEVKKLLHLMTSEAAPAYPSPRVKVPLGQHPTTTAPVNREVEKDDPTWPTPELYDHAQNYHLSKDQTATSSPPTNNNSTTTSNTTTSNTTAVPAAVPKSTKHSNNSNNGVKSYVSSEFVNGILLGASITATVVFVLANRRQCICR